MISTPVLANFIILIDFPIVILKTNNDNGRVCNLMGDAYARGWLGVDYSVSGEIIITSGEGN